MAEYEDVKPQLTPLVIGLTRSPTMWGVPYMAVVVVIGITIIAWLVSKSFWTLLLAPDQLCGPVLPLRLGQQNPRCSRSHRAQNAPRTRNKSFWGTNSYGP
ncbi:type IV secretion system protein VirB3 [Ochrobactrum haematophilum]|uniref:Type IV secretion system protein VirB3 n=1 Tax=Brucella haematophila TaxID=419474 RepID=A0ABX1DR66_9HYPH|nr:type IV secretion system protein VirB3 [Brucella haematophila]